MNIIELGRYKQIGEDASETPIQWIVLKREGSKALLLSRYILDYGPFQEGYDAQKADTDFKSCIVTWKTCSLRKWLNEEFLLHAFDPKERSMILPTQLQTESNDNILQIAEQFTNAQKKNMDTNADFIRTMLPQIDAVKGNPVFTETNDCVFLLSKEERNSFFHPQYLKVGVPTNYAYLKKAQLSKDGLQYGLISGKEETKLKLGDEWERDQRSPGIYGAILRFERQDVGIRPAIWIDLTIWGAEKGVDIAEITPVKKPEDMKRIIAQSWTESSGYPVVTMGRYKYDKKGIQYRPIEWLVLDEADGKTLLLSKNVLAHVPYDSADCVVKRLDYVPFLGIPAWEDSEMRRWLNDEFIHEAFDKEERDNIVETRIDPLPPDKNSKRKLWAFKPTTDKLFLLSREEAKHYFAGLTMEAYGTPYATYNYHYEWLHHHGANMPWVCREKALEPRLGFVQYYPSEADYDKKIYLDEYPKWGTNGVGVGVRPAMWVYSSAINQ